VLEEITAHEGKDGLDALGKDSAREPVMNALPLIFGITWLAVISPGADFAMISRNSFLHGRRAGMLAALGIAISCWFHVFYAVFGLTVMERLFPHLLNIVKIAGAAYLVYVGAATAMARLPLPTARIQVTGIRPCRPSPPAC
jgi:threonine/homoserine/homoserine lactone efflux protein